MGFGSFVGGFAGQINKEREQDRLLEIEEEKARIASERSFANSKKLMEATETIKSRMRIEEAERQIAIEQAQFKDFIGDTTSNQNVNQDLSNAIESFEKPNQVTQPDTLPSSQTGNVLPSQPGTENILNPSIQPKVNTSAANKFFRDLQAAYRQKFYTPPPEKENRS